MIADMINDSNTSVRISALRAVIALVPYGERPAFSPAYVELAANFFLAEISATILTPQTRAKIPAGLEDSAGAVKKTALKAAAVLLPLSWDSDSICTARQPTLICLDDFRVVLTSQNFQHILKLLRTGHSHKPGSSMFTYGSGVDLFNHRIAIPSTVALLFV
jgi:hypothetical protein